MRRVELITTGTTEVMLFEQFAADFVPRSSRQLVVQKDQIWTMFLRKTKTVFGSGSQNDMVAGGTKVGVC